MSDIASSDDFPGQQLTLPRGLLRANESGAVSLGRIPAAIRRQVWLILPLGVVFSAVLVAVACLVPVKYEAIATVIVNTRQVGVAISQADMDKINTDAVAIRTQVDVLKAPALARSVVASLNLVAAPEFAKVVSPQPSAVSAAIHGVINTVLLWFGVEPAPPLTQAQKVAKVVDLLLAKMDFTNDGRSYVIGISARTKNAELSAAIANAYATTYLNYTRNQKIDALHRAHTWFDERLAGLQANFRDANLQVQEFRNATGLVEDLGATNGVNTGVTVASQQLAQINNELIVASGDLAQKEASLKQLQSALAGQGSLESVPAVVQSPLIQQLRAQQALVERNAANLASTRSSNYPGVQSLQAERSAIGGRIATEARSIASSIAAEASAARAREDTLRATLARIKGQVSGEGHDQIQLRELQSAADAARAIYLSYLDLAEKTANQTGLQQPDAELVSPASVPLEPAIPTRPQLIALAIVLAFVGAAFVAARRDLAHGGFRTAEEFEAQADIAALGSVPMIRRRLLGRGKKDDRAFDEAITLTRSLACQRGGKPHVLMVTSALPGEGKTFLAVALARNAAAAGRSTLLIDCDHRHPSVAAALGPDAAAASTGLAALEGDGEGGAGLSVISDLARAGVPRDFFGSPEMAALLDRARARYDLIIMDAPPVMVSADARLMSTLADSVLLVIRWRQTPRKLVGSALDALSAHGARIRGVVLNAVVVSSLSPSESSYAYVHHKYP